MEELEDQTALVSDNTAYTPKSRISQALVIISDKMSDGNKVALIILLVILAIALIVIIYLGATRTVSVSPS